jgi:DNA-directed RNA polymerase specialized sigma24 family protein
VTREQINQMRKYFIWGLPYEDISKRTGKTVNAIALIKKRYFKHIDRGAVRDGEPMTNKQIASEMRIPQKIVDNAYQRAKKKFAKAGVDLKIFIEPDEYRPWICPQVHDGGIPWRTTDLS